MKKMKFIKKNIIILVLMISSFLSYGVTITWTGNGDGTSWSDGANWDAGLPTTVDDVIIPTGGTVACDVTTTVNSIQIFGKNGFNATQFYVGYSLLSYVGDLTVTNGITMMDEKGVDFTIEDGTCQTQTLTVNANQTTTVNALQSLTVTSDITNGGTFVIEGTLKVGGTFSPAGLVNGTTSIIEFNGVTSQTIPEISFVNLVLSNSGTKTFTVSPVVTGTFTGSTATSVIYNTSLTTQVLTGSYNNLTFQGIASKEISGNLTVTGAFSPGSCPVAYTGTADQNIITTTYNQLTFSNGNKFISGLINTTVSFTPGQTTVEYNGAGNQIVLQADYKDLVLSNTGTKIITSTIGISGTFSSTASLVTNIGTIEYNGSGAQTVTMFDYYDLTVSGDKGGATVTFGSNVGIANAMSLTASNVIYDLTTNDNTISYNGTGTQNISSFTDGYNNLLFDNSTKQLTEAIVVLGDLTITSDAILQTVGNIVTVSGNFTNNGTFTSTSGDIVRFSGSSASIISGSSSTVFENLNINKTSSSVTVNSVITINSEGAVTIENGTSTLNISSGSLTLLSTSAINTARIATIPSGSSVTGNVIAQRYIPISTNALSWWHLSNPVQGVKASDWQTYFKISGDFTGRDSIPSSLATSPKNWSVKTYDESQVTTTFTSGWKNFPTSVNTEQFTSGQGYRAYIVDSRTASTVKTLSMTGAINQGDFTFPMTFTNSGVSGAQGFAFLGNPYPSAIDFDDDANWTKTNVTNAMYVWNAEQKQWRGWSGGSSYNGGTSVIPIGQGFWVEATSASPVLKVTENAKVSNLSGLKRIAQVQNNIEVALSAKGSDEVVTTDIRFSDIATPNYDVECDISYLSRNMFSEFTSELLIDICSKTADGKSMFMNCLPISTMEIVPLVLTASSAKEYTLTLARENYSLDSDVLLVDLFLNKEVKIGDVTAYTFSQTNDSQSEIQNRFEIRINNDRIVNNNEGNDVESTYIAYPNPFNGEELVVKGVKSYENVKISITDLLGNNIYEEIIINQSSGFEKKLFFNKRLELGIYFVNFVTNNKTITQKIIVE